MQFNQHLVPNLNLNRKYGIELFEKCQIHLFVTSVALNINFNSIKDFKHSKIAKTETSKVSGPSVEVKIIFSENPSENIQFGKLSKVGLVQFFGAFAYFVLLEERLSTKL